VRPAKTYDDVPQNHSKLHFQLQHIWYLVCQNVGKRDDTQKKGLNTCVSEPLFLAHDHTQRVTPHLKKIKSRVPRSSISHKELYKEKTQKLSPLCRRTIILHWYKYVIIISHVYIMGGDGGGGNKKKKNAIHTHTRQKRTRRIRKLRVRMANGGFSVCIHFFFLPRNTKRKKWRRAAHMDWRCRQPYQMIFSFHIKEKEIIIIKQKKT
jgi:hypothetical protein